MPCKLKFLNTKIMIDICITARGQEQVPHEAETIGTLPGGHKEQLLGKATMVARWVFFGGFKFKNISYLMHYLS